MINLQKIEEEIARLPENFPAAVGDLKERILPLIAECDQSIQEYFLNKISTRLGTGRKPITELFHESISLLKQQEEDEGVYILEPEIVEAAEEIALDPLLVKRRIETVQQLGVCNEFKNIGVTLTVIDSRLNPAKQTLSAKNCGQMGGGKSHTIFTCFELFPKSAYFVITSASSKSFYGMKDQLKHRVLMVAEANVLEKDGDVAYAVRSLISEGFISYTKQENVNGQRSTIFVTIPGPMALITTTIKGTLEKQLDDRLLSIHPDTSEEQTAAIMRQRALSVAGLAPKVDEDTINAWKFFHENLESYEVVIPYAQQISEKMTLLGLPVSARRAFERVIHAIKAMTIVHQHQRTLNDQKQLVSEISDYFLVHQLFKDIFLEDIGQYQKITDEKLQLIDRNGMMTPGEMARELEISKSTLSDWIKRNLTSGAIKYCDADGKPFQGELEQLKAQKRGRAYLQVAKGPDLPTPFEITADPKWDVGGEYYQLYDLGLLNKTAPASNQEISPLHQQAAYHTGKGRRTPSALFYSNISFI